MNQLTFPSPVGALRILEHADELVGLYLPDRTTESGVERSTPVLVETARQLGEYFGGTRRLFDLPIAPRGTGFQERVWRVLVSIPFGVTWSYGELARAIGRPAASRAVGSANSKNPISIIVPCHRVIGANGTLTGYAGGLPMKKWLLEHEGGQRDLFGEPATIASP